MPKTIIISGEIGWDVYPEDVRRQFDAAAGEEVELQITTRGGDVPGGIEIYNIIKEYPGYVMAKYISLVASIGTYFAMAADKRIALSNSSFMVHNVMASFVSGDHARLRYVADVTEGYTNQVADAYSSVTGQSIDQSLQLMASESWYFGQKIKDAGFADEIEGDAIKTEAATAALLNAKASFQNFISKVKKRGPRDDDIEKIAALLPKNKTVPKNQSKNPSDKPKSKTKEKMDLNKLKNEHPDVYAQAFEEGRLAEQKRVSGHAIMAEKTGAYDFAMTCIKDGSKRVTDDDVFAEYQTAGMKKKDLKASADDAPPEIKTPTEPTESEEDKKEKEDKKVGSLVNKIMDKHKTKKQGAA